MGGGFARPPNPIPRGRQARSYRMDDKKGRPGFRLGSGWIRDSELLPRWADNYPRPQGRRALSFGWVIAPDRVDHGMIATLYRPDSSHLRLRSAKLSSPPTQAGGNFLSAGRRGGLRPLRHSVPLRKSVTTTESSGLRRYSIVALGETVTPLGLSAECQPWYVVGKAFRSRE